MQRPHGSKYICIIYVGVKQKFTVCQQTILRKLLGKFTYM